MSAPVAELGGMIAATPDAASWETGVVELIIDPQHLRVELGGKPVTAFLPSSLVGACMVGSEVIVLGQGNASIVLDVREGAWIGKVEWWLDATSPSGWLLLDGATFSAVTYPLLAAKLGGTTLIDMRDRFPVGASGTKALRSAAGSATITEAQLPQHRHTIAHTHEHVHTHTLSAHTHSYSDSSGGLPSHYHTIDVQQSSTGVTAGTDFYPLVIGGSRNTSTENAAGGSSSGTSGGPVPDYTGAASEETTGDPSNADSGNVGTGAEYWPRYAAGNYYIKAV